MRKYIFIYLSTYYFLINDKPHMHNTKHVLRKHKVVWVLKSSKEEGNSI